MRTQAFCFLRGSAADPANDTGVDTPGRMLEPNSGFPFPFPRYDNGCLPNEFKDGQVRIVYRASRVELVIHSQTKRCNIGPILDGSGNNGCYDL
jgi:hypothetical protein